MPLPVFFLLVWLVLFLVMFPLVWSAGWGMVEWRLVGSVSKSYPQKAAFVTLVTGEQYVRGARVLGHSLMMHNERSYPLIALQVGLTAKQQQSLKDVGWEVRRVDPIPFYPVDRDRSVWKWVPEKKLGAVHVQALTKMRIWEMDEFDRIVFIDSDAWVVGDVSSHLCRRTEEIVGMGDVEINSGVMSLRPDRARFRDMMDFWAHEPEKFFVYPGKSQHELNNPDQSLINGYAASRGIHIGPLSSQYNLNCRQPRGRNTGILHFNVDVVKPWNISRKAAEKRSRQMAKLKDYKEKLVWDHILNWIDIEEKVDMIYGEKNKFV